MKYEIGDVLYYVNRFVFIIEKVQVQFAYKEDDGTIYYIDEVGAYLREEELFKTWKEAQVKALELLEKFCCESRRMIINVKPTFGEDII